MAQTNKPIGHICENGFELIYKDTTSQGAVWRHTLVLQTVDDYSQVYEIARDKAKKGAEVKILPIVNQNDPLRLILFVGANENKCPDMIIDGKYADVKTLEGSLSNANIHNNVHKGQAQASWVIVRIPGDVAFWRLKLICANRFEYHPELEVIEYKIIGGNTYTFRKKDF